MKRSQVFAVLALSLLLLAAVPVQQARAQTPYSEKLNVYIAGSNGLWYFTFQGVNGSSRLTAFESSPGLSSYNITAVRTSGWTSDFQVFGPQGYNVFPVPTPPSEGVLCTLVSDSFADASAAAAALGGYMLTHFVSSANGTGSYRFYAPLTFNTVVPGTLLSLLPTGAGGFAGAITASGFETTSSPMVILEGTKASGVFERTLVVGSITALALDAASRPNILSIYGTTSTSLRAANRSTSSIIQVHVLDGIMRNKDKAATVANDTAHFSSTYTLQIPASKKVATLNTTVLQQPAQLLAYRTVTSGALHTGQVLEVTLSLTDLSPSRTLTNVTFSDNWWNSSGLFILQTPKNSTTVPTSIAGGNAVTPVYKLRYIGNGTGKLTIPASVIIYSYTVGSAAFRGSAVLNPIALSLGTAEPVVYSYVAPTGGFGKSVGTPQSLKVTVVNVGTQPASSVVVAGQPISGLGVNASASVTVTQSAQGLTGVNLTQSYSTAYQDLASNNLIATTNVISDVFSHSSMKLGFASLVVTQVTSPFKSPGSGTNLTLTFTTSNKGTGNVTSFTARGSLPQGLPCGAIKGNGTTCSSGVISLNYSTIGSQKTMKSRMAFNVTVPMNFLLAPLESNWVSVGVSGEGSSNPLGIPTGMVVSKQFVPSQLFGGMTSVVGVAASNRGPFTIYNVTFGSSVDSFDSLSATASTSRTAVAIPGGSNSTLTYSVKAISTQGTLNSTGSTATFYFGGTQFTRSFAGPRVTIYQPLSAQITTSPSSATEGKPFTLMIAITNPSAVSVSTVVFSIPLPSGLTITQPQGMSISGKNITILASSLAPHTTLNATATAQASSGITVPFNKATLTFVYGGVKVSGTIPQGGIAIGENVTTRYLIPIAIVLLVLLAAVYYVRKISLPSVPASRQ